MSAADDPIAMGGIGGSGTRVGAALLARLGRTIGEDINESLDNLWFTLLFKRRSILLETDADFGQLCDLFWDRMGGTGARHDEAQDILARLAARTRLQHDTRWLWERVRSWLDTPSTPGAAWAWKEPNTHLVIDRLLTQKAELRYIHIVRNPLDMALSSNQNQLENWGPIILDRPVEIGPRDSLTYGCAVTKRLYSLSAEYGDRIYLIDFDRLCRDPEGECQRIATFVGVSTDNETLSWFGDLVRNGAPSEGRGRAIDRTTLAPGDLEYVASLGYNID